MPDINDLTARVRTMQVIALAMPAGLIGMVGVSLVVGNRAAPPAQPLLSMIAAGAMGLMIVMSYLVPRLLRETQLRQLAANSAATPQQLVGVHLSMMIVGLALLEGAGFFCAIAFLIEGQLWVLPLILVDLVLMVLRVPTESSVVNWLDAAGRRMNELRG